MKNFSRFKVKNKLGDYAHDAWSRWMEYLFSKSIENKDGSVTIPKEFVDRWKRQIATSYENLSKEEQKSDLAEAEKMLKIIEQS